MKQAYDFAVEHVGIDFHSTTLWADYISFLKSEYVYLHILHNFYLLLVINARYMYIHVIYI